MYPLLRDNLAVIENETKDKDKKSLYELLDGLEKIELDCHKLSPLPEWFKKPGKKVLTLLDNYGSKYLQKELDDLK
jgi:hypothetical protein